MKTCVYPSQTQFSKFFHKDKVRHRTAAVLPSSGSASHHLERCACSLPRKFHHWAPLFLPQDTLSSLPWKCSMNSLMEQINEWNYYYAFPFGWFSHTASLQSFSSWWELFGLIWHKIHQVCTVLQTWVRLGAPTFAVRNCSRSDLMLWLSHKGFREN